VTQAAASPLTAPEAYRDWFTEHVRFADLDPLGHVNNKAFLTYAESGRAAFLMATGLWSTRGPRQTVVARVEIDYRRELHYPGEVRVGLHIARLGRSSFTIGQGMFSAASCIATMRTVMVRIDAASRQAVELDADERALLAPFLAFDAA
jgi:acyl-CoA thioester hydrolase